MTNKKINELDFNQIAQELKEQHKPKRNLFGKILFGLSMQTVLIFCYYAARSSEYLSAALVWPLGYGAFLLFKSARR